MLFDKLRQIEERSQEIDRALADPSIYSRSAELARLRKEQSDLQETVDRFREYRDVLKRIGEARHILSEGGDRELAELATPWPAWPAWPTRRPASPGRACTCAGSARRGRPCP